MSRAAYQILVGEDDITADVLIARGAISWERGLDQLRVLSPPRAGELELVVDNAAGTYNPPASLLRAGRRLRVLATYDEEERELFAGILDHPSFEAESFRETVQIRAFGPLSLLAGKSGISTELYQALDTGAAIEHVLDAIGWPEEDRKVDTGLTQLEYWWLDGEDPLEALRELLATEGPGALLYEDGAGSIVFKNRHARILEERSSDSQGTYGPAALPLIEPVSYDLGLRDVVNQCTVITRRREIQALDVIWTLGGDPVVLAPGESRSWSARGADRTIFPEAEEPSEGAGDFSVDSGSLASVALERSSGASSRITLTAGAAGAVVSGLRLRARLVPVVSETSIASTLDVSGSLAEFGVQPFPLRIRPEISENVAQDFANAVVAFYQQGREQIEFTSINRDGAAIEAILDREIGDRVRAILPRLGIDRELLILQRSDLLYQGLNHRVTFGTEPADTADYFQLDSSELDGADVLAW